MCGHRQHLMMLPSEVLALAELHYMEYSLSVVSMAPNRDHRWMRSFQVALYWSVSSRAMSANLDYGQVLLCTVEISSINPFVKSGHSGCRHWHLWRHFQLWAQGEKVIGVWLIFHPQRKRRLSTCIPSPLVLVFFQRHHIKGQPSVRWESYCRRNSSPRQFRQVHAESKRYRWGKSFSVEIGCKEESL